jgi:MFS transporter, DHA2 family, multidrug resistance protein
VGAIPLEHHWPVGESLSRGGEAPHRRVDDYFQSHGVTDATAAHHQAIVALGNFVKRQALIMGFSDTSAVIGTVLAIAAVALLFARKVKIGASAGGAH